jgi:hypothetical protein
MVLFFNLEHIENIPSSMSSKTIAVQCQQLGHSEPYRRLPGLVDAAWLQNSRHFFSHFVHACTLAWRGLRPRFEIAEVGGQRAQRVCAHAFLGQVLQGLDVVVDEQEGELVAAVNRQDRRKRVELRSALICRSVEERGCFRGRCRRFYLVFSQKL